MIYIGVVLLSVLAASVTAHVTPKDDFERGVLKLIDKCKSGDVASLPVPLPSLNPLVLPAWTTNHALHTMYVGEKRVYGLANLSVNMLSTSPTGMLIEFYVPQLQIHADYYHLQRKLNIVKAVLGDDQGTFRCDVSNVKIRADMQFGNSGANTVITYLDLSYSVGGVQVFLSGSNILLQTGASAELRMILHSSETKEIFRKLIIKLAGKYLQGHTPEEFRKMISTF